MPSFVQLPHPGREHRPTPRTVGTVMPWNVGDHKRKFIRARGRYLVQGREHEGDFAFWGEWESQSRVVEVWPKDGENPRFIHEPLRPASPGGGEHQNTDPLVFGGPFLYTNCKQLHNAKLRRLAPGSLVLFGSGQGPGFVLDTVFVVGEDNPDYEFGELGVVADHPLADDMVFGPLASLARYRGRHCRAYRGASWAAGHDGLFSFVPSRPLEGDVRFERPLLEPIGPLAELVNPKLRMGARVLEVSEERIAHAWAHVRKVVELQRLALGVHLEPPTRTATEGGTGPSAAAGC